jgi:16S rRNA (uracil1498-N3)-methyltransferase
VQYLYHEAAGSPQLTLQGDMHRYIFKVRRHKAEEELFLRNLKDGLLYRYTIMTIDKHSAMLVLQESLELEIGASRLLHIGWCMIDPKSIEKVLPSLNEMGVEKITFIYCKRSQKSFKPDFKRWEKILMNSSQQSGRSVMMELEMMDNLQDFLEKYPESNMLNFSQNPLSNQKDITTIIIGCEGGFHEDEVSLFQKEKIVGFETSLVLKSESAACAVASKILL